MNKPLPYLTVGLVGMLACILSFGIHATTMIFSCVWFSLCATAFIASSRSDTGEKIACWGAFSLFCLMLVMQIPYMLASPFIGAGFIQFLSILTAFVVSTVVIVSMVAASNIFRVDGVTPKHGRKIYLVIKRPKSWVDYLISTIGSPVSSVSFCVGDDWLRYTKRDGSAESCDTFNAVGYTFVDTGLVANDMQYQSFSEMEHKRWSFKNNCVTAWYNFTSGTMLEHKVWEWLPSIYVKRVIKEINSHD